jgi:hypothetical protein
VIRKWWRRYQQRRAERAETEGFNWAALAILSGEVTAKEAEALADNDWPHEGPVDRAFDRGARKGIALVERLLADRESYQ